MLISPIDLTLTHLECDLDCCTLQCLISPITSYNSISCDFLSTAQEINIHTLRRVSLAVQELFPLIQLTACSTCGVQKIDTVYTIVHHAFNS